MCVYIYIYIVYINTKKIIYIQQGLDGYRAHKSVTLVLGDIKHIIDHQCFLRKDY